MTSATTHPLIEDYLRRLDAALQELPGPSRAEIRDEIVEHIDAATEGTALSEAEVRNLLERLGDPYDIVRAAHDDSREESAPRRLGGTEILALVLLPIGGVLLPFVGWFAGVILLWVSDMWTRRDKVIGTLFLPGGLALPLWLYFFVPPSAASQNCEGVLVEVGPGGHDFPPPGACTTDYAYIHPAAGYFVLIVAFVIPIVTAIYLGRRARRHGAAIP